MERKKLTYFPISLLLMYLLYCVIDAPEEIVFFFKKALKVVLFFFYDHETHDAANICKFLSLVFFVNPWLELLMRCPIR